MSLCESSPTRCCPISKDPCPGVCLYAEILDNLNTGVIVVDTDRKRVAFQNRLAAKLFAPGVQPRDYAALSSLLLGEPQAQASGPSATQPRSLRVGDRLLGYTVHRIVEHYAWIFVRDITEKTRLEAIAEAATTMRNIGYIFSGIRHEIGNPMNTIKMALSVLRNSIDRLPKETVVEYIERCMRELNRMEYLLRALKNFTMYEAPQVQAVEIRPFLWNLADLIALDFKGKGVVFNAHCDTDSGCMRVDPRALHQVLMNLLTNAMDAVEGRDEPTVHLRANWHGDRVRITISDNGCGMSEEQKKHLFKPFHTTKTSGTGLGLVIVQKMLASMDSTIEIQSWEHAGTLVTLSLPGGQDGNA